MAKYQRHTVHVPQPLHYFSRQGADATDWQGALSTQQSPEIAPSPLQHKQAAAISVALTDKAYDEGVLEMTKNIDLMKKRRNVIPHCDLHSELLSWRRSQGATADGPERSFSKTVSHDNILE
jgi:hypothetical protein